MPYQIFNENEAMNRVFDKDLIKELLIDFTKMKELDWHVLDQHISKNNFEAIERISHSIKGVSGNLALTGIYMTSTALNDAVKLEKMDLIKFHYEEVKSEVDRFLAFLPEYLNS